MVPMPAGRSSHRMATLLAVCDFLVLKGASDPTACGQLGASVRVHERLEHGRPLPEASSSASPWLGVLVLSRHAYAPLTAGDPGTEPTAGRCRGFGSRNSVRA
jgi:hypothetical protein